MPEASLSRAPVKQSEVLTDAVKQRAAQANQATQRTTVSSNADAISNNPVAQILTDKSRSPIEKKTALIALMTATEDKTRNKANEKAYRAWEEHLQNVRENLAQEIIALTDTGAVSELQAIYKEMQQRLVDYNGRIEPLVSLTESIYRLRTSGKAGAAFEEIMRDREEEARVQKILDDLDVENTDILAKLETQDETIRVSSQERGMFGFGGITNAAKDRIKGANDEKVRLLGRLEKNRDKKANTKPAALESSMGENEADKAELRRLLDLNSDEWKERQKDLVDSAREFISTSKVRTLSVRDHLGDMDTQIERLADANSRMGGMYAIMSDAMSEAKDNSLKLSDTLGTAEEGEGNIARREREDRQTIVGDHIESLNAAFSSTVSTAADLTGQNIRIGTMKKSNTAQLDQARLLSSQGVAGVADRLSVVLQAVGGAALGESTAGARDILQQMKRSTDNISQKDTIRLAMGMEDTNKDIQAMMDGLMQAGEVLNTSNQITRESLGTMLTNLDRMSEAARGVEETIRARDSIAADANRDRAGAPTSSQPAPKQSDPLTI